MQFIAVMAKLNFPSEIILIFQFGAQEIFVYYSIFSIIINDENSCAA